jgi:flagellar motor switch protein FliG
MCAIGEIGPHAIAQAISSFAHSAGESGIPFHGRVDNVRRIMAGALGEVKADSLMRRVAPPQEGQRTPALDLAQWLEPEVLIPLVKDEHPQAIAVLLVQLDPVAAAAVLAGLPEELHTPVVHRIARLGPVSPDAIAILEETLATRIAASHGKAPLQMGGVREAAEIINNAARSIEKRVVPAIGKIDKQLARELENEMFKFEHLFGLDTQMMGQLMREIESELLIDALKGIEETQRECFYAAMSTRAADGLKDEIEARGRLKRADADAAQKQIVAVAKRLAADGVIVIGSGGEDDYV